LSEEKWAVLDSNEKLQRQHNKELIENSKTQQVHNPVHILTIYPELGVIVKTWPNLPEHIKETIKVLIQMHKGKK
jgi:Lhr-like helicase